MVKEQRKQRAALLGTTCAIAGALGACNRDARLADRNIRHVEVEPVTLYDVTLDEAASPEQVAFVLLKAIRADFLAASPEERQAALDKQFRIAAADVIAHRTSSALDRDEIVYNVVYRWTPTVAHYVNDFPTDLDSATARMVRRVPARRGDGADRTPNEDEVEIAMVVNDPSGDAAARVVMLIWLAKDKGMWRVVHLGFDPTRRNLGGL